MACKTECSKICKALALLVKTRRLDVLVAIAACHNDLEVERYVLRVLDAEYQKHGEDGGTPFIQAMECMLWAIQPFDWD